VASGKSSVTLGEASTASGDQTTAIGQGSKALALHSVAAGPFPVARGNPTTWVNTDPVFTVANGQSDTARSNALVVLKSGAVLVKPAGDLSMGSFTAGIKPDDTTP
jgi:Head domain of trimeric autotransporter adhesin